MAAHCSLWLPPPPALERDLAREIEGLAARFDTPQFAPHITLLSGTRNPDETALNLAERLARELTPFEIELTHAEFLDEYFRCVFLVVTPTSPLARAFFRAEEIFDQVPCTEFMPHLSLIYGELPRETREELAAEIGDRLRTTFLCNCLDVMECDTSTDPEEWTRLRRLPLGGQRSETPE